MTTFLKVFCFAFLFSCASAGLQGQSVGLIRNDVDASRSHFVTATFRFGVDVKLTDVQGCNGASFELRFSNAQYVRYSGYSGGDFGETGVVVIDRSDILTGDGRLFIGVLSGNPAGSSGIDNPVALRLDFVVAPDAPHGNISTFSFVSAKAVVNQDSGSVIDLRGNNTSYAIRSFIQIWPGDADNDGKVNTNDISTIGSFLTNSDNEGPYRGFKRQPASAYWTPQTALAWDSVLATSADCDGSGEVTLNDILVVQLNFFRERAVSKIYSADETLASSPYYNPKPIAMPAGAVKIPVYCSASRSFIGAAARISWGEAKPSQKVVGVEPSAEYSGDILCYTRVNQELRYADIAVGTINADIKASGSNPELAPSNRFLLCYLIIDSLGSDVFPLQMLQHPTGITASGQFFPLDNALLSAERTDRSASFSATLRNSSIVVESEAAQKVGVIFYNIIGEVVCAPETIEISGGGAVILFPDLPNGAYIAVASGGGKSIALPLTIIK